MVKIEIDNIKLTFPQIKRAVHKLPTLERAKLVEGLIQDKDTWKIQFRRLLTRIDHRVKKYPISQKEIDEIVKEGREEYYAKRRH